MSHTFKVGDCVKCVDVTGVDVECDIEYGGLYLVRDVSKSGNLILITGDNVWYFTARFELVHSEPIDYSNTTTLEEPPMENFVGRKKTPVEIALEGHNGPGQQAIAKAGVELTTLLLKKNTDYGNSAMTPPILAPTMSAREAIQCRMSDKIRRLERLLAGNTAEVNESIEDTISDLGGYSILWLSCEDS